MPVWPIAHGMLCIRFGSQSGFAWASITFDLLGK